MNSESLRIGNYKRLYGLGSINNRGIKPFIASFNKNPRPIILTLVAFFKLGLLGYLIGFGSFVTEA